MLTFTLSIKAFMSGDWNRCCLAIAISLSILLFYYAIFYASILSFRVQTWIVAGSDIASRSSLFGIGRTRRRRMPTLDRVELREAGSGSAADPDTPYSLTFVGRDGKDLFTIADLTEGEALWIGGELCRWLPPGAMASLGTAGATAALWDSWIDE
jgi:hypothetical protein